MYIDVFPIDDIKSHIDGPLCECNPTIENRPEYHTPLCIHNSFDNREIWEKQIKEDDLKGD